jgi:glutamine synthetase
MMNSTLQDMSTKVFDHATMAMTCGDEVANRFLANIASGDPTSEPDKKAIAEAMFKWATELGAYGYAHWFFPMRGGSGAPAGSIGALKEDAFVDLDWSSKLPIKPFEAAFPPERLFVGETDGSSFPNGGLRMTHRAAAFTT